MLVRRCAIVLFEPVEDLRLDLRSLGAGGDGVARVMSWQALAPHLDAPVQVDAAQRELIGVLSPSRWVEADAMQGPLLEGLIALGLVVSDAPAHAPMRERDERLRLTHWHPLAAVLHAFTRWDGVDTVANMRDAGTVDAVQLRARLGPPPTEVRIHGGDDVRMALERPESTPLDALFARRATCRNFDAARPLPKGSLSQVMMRTFAVHGRVDVTSDLAFLKKNVPSGGGLHPIEAYLVVQHVEGVSAGLYHYRPDLHAIEHLPQAGRPSREFVLAALAQQHWFADAHVLVIMVCRYERTFWKYRRHAKGYRVVAMEAGHLSQQLALAATDAGLGAFVTGAVNERQIERALNLDPAREGVLAVCGFGWRGQHMHEAELDPAARVWSP